jgi:hypothetical protein
MPGIIAGWGFRLLAGWAIVSGICIVFGVGHPVLNWVLGAVLAIAGGLILFSK